MRLLMLSYEFPPIGGGGGAVVKGLATELVRLGNTVDVLTMNFRDLPEKEVIDGITVYRVNCGRRREGKCTAIEALVYVVKARAMLRKLLQSKRYSLVHVHFIFPDGVLALAEVAPNELPFVITAHGSDVPGYNSKIFFKLVHPLIGRVWNKVTRSADMVISPSQSLRTLIENSDPDLGVQVIPNGIDPGRFEFRATSKEKYILVAARLVKRKGVQYLLEALSKIENPWPAFVVGSGEYQSELKRINMSLGEPAKFVGWLDNQSKEFKSILERSEIYVLISDMENFPVSLLEAMAAGCAIVTTRGHGCEEVVGNSAELITSGARDARACVKELRQALDKLIVNHSYRAKLGKSARERLETRFSWSSVAQEYLKVYTRYGTDHSN